MKSKLLIIGASGHGKVVADIAMKMKQWDEIAFLDDNPDISTSLGLKVLGNTKCISDFIEHYDIFIGIGNNDIREKLFRELKKNGASIPVLIHPNTIIGEEVEVGIGTVVMAGVIINSSTSIGKGCIINTGATIDHDNEIDDFVHISPGVNTAGNVRIGYKTWVGIGSVISNNINICSNCIIGAGSLVIKDLLCSGTYVGSPVKKIST